MIIGVPKEVKKEEHRAVMTPFGVEELRKYGHTILAETGAGEAGKGSKGEITNKALAESIGITYKGI